MIAWPHLEQRSGRERRRNTGLPPADDRRSGTDRRRSACPQGSLSDENMPAWSVAIEASLPPELCGRARRASPATKGQATRELPPAAVVDRSCCTAVSVLPKHLDRLAIRLLETTERLYAAAQDPDVWPAALAEMAGLVGADGAAIMVCDERRRLHHIGHTVGLDHFGSIILRTPPELFCALADDVSALRQPGVTFATAALQQADAHLYAMLQREWIERGGWDDVLFGVIDSRDGETHYLLLVAGGGRRAFTSNELSIVARLLPDVRQALRIERSLRTTAPLLAAMATALERSPLGIAIIDRRGGCVYANRRGVEIVGPETDALEWFGQAVQLVPRSAEQAPLSVVTVPIESDNDTLSPCDPPPLAGVIFVSDPEQRVALDESALQQLYGLTRTEARVAALLAQGRSIDEIAEALWAQYDTVRKHLQKVFVKTGTNRQSALVTLLLTSPVVVAT